MLLGASELRQQDKTMKFGGTIQGRRCRSYEQDETLGKVGVLRSEQVPDPHIIVFLKRKLSKLCCFRRFLRRELTGRLALSLF